MTIDYADLTAVKEWLHIEPTNTTEDALLSRMITSASAWIATFLSREIALATHTETFDGVGGMRQMLTNTPVVSIVSATIDDIVIDPMRYRRDEFGVVFKGAALTRGLGNVEISYTGGYAVVPEDIVQCTIDIVAFNYRRRERIGHASKSLAGEVVSFITSDIPPECKQTLKQYRRVHG